MTASGGHIKTYRIAVLGCRNRGTAAALAYYAHPRTEVVALCELVPELLDSLGFMLGVSTIYSDLDAMIAETAPDIVAIPTGTEFHHELCLKVLVQGGDIAGEFITATMQFQGGIRATLVQHRFPEMALIGHYMELYWTEKRILCQSHQSIQREVNQVPYELPSDLEAAIPAFVTYYNYSRYHMALSNVTPD
ncbi:MAG: Gfo/Idh/MocA family oxidoreductase, partial [SAR202 cluster bacterium]|nr:Gfo/Idh/MocA family oxidoreductase [SAR202 cluster bacterium]